MGCRRNPPELAGSLASPCTCCPAIRHLNLSLLCCCYYTTAESTVLPELYGWWLKLLLRPAVDAVLVAHAHVPLSKVVATETLTAADIEREAGGGAAGTRDLAGSGLALLQQLLAVLGKQEPGSYLLTHSPGEDTCLLFRALPPKLAETMQVGAAAGRRACLGRGRVGLWRVGTKQRAHLLQQPGGLSLLPRLPTVTTQSASSAAAWLQGELPPLPCSVTQAQPSAIYDLHAGVFACMQGCLGLQPTPRPACRNDALACSASASVLDCSAAAPAGTLLPAAQ